MDREPGCGKQKCRAGGCNKRTARGRAAGASGNRLTGSIEHGGSGYEAMQVRSLAAAASAAQPYDQVLRRWIALAMAILTLKLNSPLDLAALAAILPGTDDLLLVWPDAKRPFDPEQWRTALTARPHSKSYLVELAGEIVGHAALLGDRGGGCPRCLISLYPARATWSGIGISADVAPGNRSEKAAQGSLAEIAGEDVQSPGRAHL